MEFSKTNNTAFVSNSSLKNSVGRLAIYQLKPNVQHTIIVGLVLAKNSIRSITNSRGVDRFLLCFTIRDSPRDSINCSCWGSSNYISGLTNSFTIGDVVEIRNAQIQMQDSNARFRPATNSDFLLNLSENASSLTLHVGDTRIYSNLLNIPLKCGCPILSIAEVRQREKFQGEYANLLVAVQKIGATREMVSKTGRPLTKCDITVFDQTSKSFSIQLWDSEWINYAKTWTPRDCIILAQDIKLNYDSYRQTMSATADGKTVFTVNPDIREVRVLYTFIQSMILEDDPTDVNLETIQDVYTVESLAEKVRENSDKSNSFRGIIYACLSHMDLDGPRSWASTPACTSSRCSLCKRIANSVIKQCTNLECAAGCGIETTQLMQQLDMNISLTDYTGTLDNCNFNGTVAETFLGCTVTDFLQMTPTQKTKLKWQFLLERTKWYLQVSTKNFGKTLAIIILGGETVDAGEWCTKVSTKN